MDEPEYQPVTAAVTPPRLPTDTANALTTPTVPTGWTLSAVAALVRDIAMNLYDEDTILAKHRLTRPQYEILQKNTFFQNAIAQATTEWHSPASTTKRLAMQAAIAVEDGLPTVAARLSNPNEPLGDIVSLLKVLADIAGVVGGKAAANQPAGERFKITINLGADTILREAAPMIAVNQEPPSESTS